MVNNSVDIRAASLRVSRGGLDPDPYELMLRDDLSSTGRLWQGEFYSIIDEIFWVLEHWIG